MAELSQLQEFAARVVELLPLVVKAVSYTHYTHHLNMKETLCQRVSVAFNSSSLVLVWLDISIKYMWWNKDMYVFNIYIVYLG